MLESISIDKFEIRSENTFQRVATEMSSYKRMELLLSFGMMFGLQFVDTTFGTTKSGQTCFVRKWVMREDNKLERKMEIITQVMDLELESARRKIIGRLVLEVVTTTNLAANAAIVLRVEIVKKMMEWQLLLLAVNHRQLFSILHVQV